MDKITLGSSAILGIQKATHLTTDQLGMIFYLGYLKFPVGKWMSLNIFVWRLPCAVMPLATLCRSLRHSVLIHLVAQITSGFISFGFEPWQLMIITGALTLVTAALFLQDHLSFLFPDSPTNAWFLTIDERVKRFNVLKCVENKHFKNDQMIEALTDKKTWLFATVVALANVLTSISNQFQIIISSLHSGVFLVNFLPWHDRVGLLFSCIATTGHVIAIAWVSQTTAGHTKRITTNAIILSCYCVGNAAGPFMWQAKYKPRNHVPLLFAVRVLLSRENKRRDAEPLDDTYDNVYLTMMDQDGNREEAKVAKVWKFLDLTDRQNKDFRYVL
ncbi:hypothetical protein EI94DRAFT_1752060 [Lactarius quietus]|nr:hypothetical protein EI94DRAFT_1752060 [Lactarius quietus]